MALTQRMMRRGHSQRPPCTENISLATRKHLDARSTLVDSMGTSTHQLLTATTSSRQTLFTSTIPRSDKICRDPSCSRRSLRYTAQTSSKINTSQGVHSTKDPRVSTYTIFVYLLHAEAYYKDTVKRIITSQLTDMPKVWLPTSTRGLEAVQFTDNLIYAVKSELYDKPITSTTQVIPSQLSICPYSFTLTLPTFSTVTYGLLLLAYRQTMWTTSI
jgi:hypothetical protein